MATKEATALICVESFVGFYDDEGTKQFIGRQDRTIIDADSREAKLWGKFFEPLHPEFKRVQGTRDPYPVEQATAAPGEKRTA